MEKLLWYIKKWLLLCVVLVRLLIYCVTNPKEISKLFFSLFSTINEFYQTSHGQLESFQKTQTYQKIIQDKIFAQNNAFNADSKVTRAIETQVLSALVCAFKPKTIFEIGTYNGFTTLHFAMNSPEDCRIYTLDLSPDFEEKYKKKLSEYSYDDLLVVRLSMAHIGNRIYKSHSNASKIEELFGDSSQFDFSPYYGKMDFIFIDGNHSYKHVKSDTEEAIKMLSTRGVIVWHDFDYIIHRDVFKYLNELSRSLAIYSIPDTRFAIYGKDLS